MNCLCDAAYYASRVLHRVVERQAATIRDRVFLRLGDRTPPRSRRFPNSSCPSGHRNAEAAGYGLRRS